MIVSVHQPQYLAWIGYFDKIDRADTFVLLDDVQFKKNEWQNRNKIRTKKEWQWLTVPVSHNFGQKISDVLINNRISWQRKHLNALITNYSRAPFFDEYIPLFKEAYDKEWLKLVDINVYFIKKIAVLLGIKTKLVLSSDLNTSGQKANRLLNICKALKATGYICGPDGPKYMDVKIFEKEGIKLIMHDFAHPVYPQVGSKDESDFLPFMSIVDLLFNQGRMSLSVIRSTRKKS